jgi:hypothetical protein
MTNVFNKFLCMIFYTILILIFILKKFYFTNLKKIDNKYTTITITAITLNTIINKYVVK